MPQYNNSASNPFQELKGSALVSVAPYTAGTPSWTNIGPVRGIEVKEDMTAVDIEFDNTAKRKVISKQEMTVAFQQMQRLNPAIMQILRSGVDTFTTTAGTLVEDHEQVVASGAWAYSKFILIENQNYDLSAITINSVTGSVDGALVLDTDYYVAKDDQNRYGIVVLDSATVTTLVQTITIDHDYTPSASFRTQIGGATELPYVMMKFESITANENGTQGLHIVICYRGQQEAGSEWVYTQDAADDPLVANPISFRFFEDSNRLAGTKKTIAENFWTTAV
jgi:hypothetical protein